MSISEFTTCAPSAHTHASTMVCPEAYSPQAIKVQASAGATPSAPARHVLRGQRSKVSGRVTMRLAYQVLQSIGTMVPTATLVPSGAVQASGERGGIVNDLIEGVLCTY